jgi:bifunctional DNase/RNase
VKIVRTVPVLTSRPGRMPKRGALSDHLVVLADDAGRRAVPLWLRVSDPKSLWHRLHRPAEDTAMVGGLEETAARLLETAGVRVTAVDIEPASEDVPELSSDTVAASIGLATAAGDRHARVSAGYGLALAVAAGAPVRVADEVLDRLALPVQGEDVLAPFLTAAAAGPPGRSALRRRFEPRNMAFTDGLDRWDLDGSFVAAGRPHWQDYSAAAADGIAVLAAAVPEPTGFAVLVQAINADDYRDHTVTFRGELRATGLAGQAGLHVAAGRPGEPPGADLRDRGGSSLTGQGSSQWSWHEATTEVPGNAGVIRFGVSLTGPGRIELRNPELTSTRPAARE